uniref:Uncharacterized protein n=1 Tax=Arundo donax TaxID=35708 RepID=A0A0A9FMZ3_ARUDO
MLFYRRILRFLPRHTSMLVFHFSEKGSLSPFCLLEHIHRFSQVLLQF